MEGQRGKGEGVVDAPGEGVAAVLSRVDRSGRWSQTSDPDYHQSSAHAQSLSCVRLFVIPWTVAHQAPLSMGFSRQEY